MRANLFDFSDGHLVTGPSTSPENGFLKDGQKFYVCAGPSIDTEICHEIFLAVEKVGEILNLDKDYSRILKKTTAKLPPLKISPKG